MRLVKRPALLLLEEQSKGGSVDQGIAPKKKDSQRGRKIAARANVAKSAPSRPSRQGRPVLRSTE